MARIDRAIEMLLDRWHALVDNGDMSAEELEESLQEQVDMGCQGWDSCEDDLEEDIAAVMAYDLDDMTEEQWDEWLEVVQTAAKMYLSCQ